MFRLPGFFRTFTAQVGFMVFTIMAGSLIALSLFWHWQLVRTTRNQIVEAMNDLTSEVDAAMDIMGPSYTAHFVTTLAQSHHDNRLLIVWQDGKKISGDLQHWPPIITTTPQWTTWELTARQNDTARPLVGRVRKYPHGQRVLLAYDMTALTRIRAAIWKTIFQAIMLSAGMAAVAAGAVGWWLNRKLLILSRTLQAITGGDLTRRLPAATAPDGLGQLSTTINATLEWLGSLLTLTQHSQSALAHDVRTPLSRLRVTLEDLLAEAPPKGRQKLAQAIAQVDGLLTYAHRLLTLARVNSGSPRLEFKRVDLTALLTDLAEAYAPVLEEHGQKLKTGIPEHLTTTGDAQLLSQALFNLLENARKYGAPKQTLSLAAVQNVPPNTLQITLINQAAKAPQTQEPGSSTGLGLQLVHAIAQLHKGTFALTHPSPKQTRATLTLPLSPHP